MTPSLMTLATRVRSSSLTLWSTHRPSSACTGWGRPSMSGTFHGRTGAPVPPDGATPSMSGPTGSSGAWLSPLDGPSTSRRPPTCPTAPLPHAPSAPGTSASTAAAKPCPGGTPICSSSPSPLPPRSRRTSPGLPWSSTLPCAGALPAPPPGPNAVETCCPVVCRTPPSMLGPAPTTPTPPTDRPIQPLGPSSPPLATSGRMSPAADPGIPPSDPH